MIAAGESVVCLGIGSLGAVGLVAYSHMVLAGGRSSLRATADGVAGHYEELGAGLAPMDNSEEPDLDRITVVGGPCIGNGTCIAVGPGDLGVFGRDYLVNAICNTPASTTGDHRLVQEQDASPLAGLDHLGLVVDLAGLPPFIHGFPAHRPVGEFCNVQGDCYGLDSLLKVGRFKIRFK